MASLKSSRWSTGSQRGTFASMSTGTAKINLMPGSGWLQARTPKFEFFLFLPLLPKTSSFLFIVLRPFHLPCSRLANMSLLQFERTCREDLFPHLGDNPMTDT